MVLPCHPLYLSLEILVVYHRHSNRHICYTTWRLSHFHQFGLNWFTDPKFQTCSSDCNQSLTWPTSACKLQLLLHALGSIFRYRTFRQYKVWIILFIVLVTALKLVTSAQAPAWRWVTYPQSARPCKFGSARFWKNYGQKVVQRPIPCKNCLWNNLGDSIT